MSTAGRAAGRVQVCTQLAGNDVRERRLPKAGRPVKQDVVCGFAALTGRREQDLEVLLDALLTDVLGQKTRPERRLHGDFLDTQRARCERPAEVFAGVLHRARV